MSRRFVLTGGPGVGKTTLLGCLAIRGYPTVRETARDLIEQQKALNSPILPWRDKPAFQRLVLETQLAREAAAGGDIVFLDRGVPDGIAYLALEGLPPLPELLEYSHGRYTGAFLLDPLSDYLRDSVRREDPKTASRLQALLEQTYRELGYEVVRIGAMPVEERADRVLEEVRKRS